MTLTFTAVLDLLGALAPLVVAPAVVKLVRNPAATRTLSAALAGMLAVLFVMNIANFLEIAGLGLETALLDQYSDVAVVLLPVLLLFLLSGLVENRARKLLEEQEHRLRWLIATTSDGIMIQRDARIIECNRLFETMTGYSREELLGMDARRLVPKEYHPMLDERIRSGSEEPYEIEGVRKNGARFPALLVPRNLGEQNGVPILGISVRDLTIERRQRLKLERLSKAVQHAAEAIVITNAEGTIEYVNPAFTEITGYSAAEAIGQNPRILKSGRQDEAFYQTLWSTITSGKVWRGRFVNRRKDGTLYHEQAAIAPVRDDAGRITQFVAVKRDITSEEHLREQLLQSQKLEAVGQLAGGVAHDFNNILQAVLGNLGFVLEDTPPDDSRYPDLMEIHKSLERAAQITKRLLAFSRRHVMQPEDLDLNEIVRDLLKMLRAMVPENIEIDFVPADRLGRAFADRTLIEQAIINLVVNARDAMPNGGRLTIETTNVVIDEDYIQSHPWAEKGRYVLLIVSDTGVGMPPEVLQHVFEPFFTTKEKGKGTGLGLSMVHGIVQQHGGMINVYSEVNKGTSFKIYLPLGERRAVDVPRLPGQTTVRGGTETILLAEDDPSVLAVGRRILEAAGYTVLAAADGDAAVKVFDRHADEIDAAVLDVMMPGRNGREVYDYIRSRRPGLPVLFCSGYTENAVHTNFVLKEGFHLLTKPYTRDEILRALRRELDAGSDAPPDSGEVDGV